MSPLPDRNSALPEGRWLWRRLYVFSTSAAAWFLLERIVGRLPDAAAFSFARGLMGLLALTMILYLVAPTAQQLGASLAQFFGRGAR